MDYLSPVHVIADFVQYKISRQIQRLVIDIALRKVQSGHPSKIVEEIY